MDSASMLAGRKSCCCWQSTYVWMDASVGSVVQLPLCSPNNSSPGRAPSNHKWEGCCCYIRSACCYIKDGNRRFTWFHYGNKRYRTNLDTIVKPSQKCSN